MLFNRQTDRQRDRQTDRQLNSLLTFSARDVSRLCVLIKSDLTETDRQTDNKHLSFIKDFQCDFLHVLYFPFLPEYDAAERSLATRD